MPTDQEQNIIDMKALLGITGGGTNGLFEYDTNGDIQHAEAAGIDPFELDTNGDIQHK